MAEVVVEGSGPGVADADLDRIFRPGVTTKDRASGHGGHGLFLCRLIVEDHGGRIEATRSLDAELGGLRLAITLPATAAGARTAPGPSPTSKRTRADVSR